jgi:cysteine synthase A
LPIVDGVHELIGSTPLIRLRKLSPEGGAEVCAKLESQNPSGSVKDRPALAMLEAAELQGVVSAGATLVEATSGNTGISLAMLCAARGYRCVLVMPEDASMARRYLLQAYGAELVLTEATGGMAEAVRKAEGIVRATPGAFMPKQFENPHNPAAHARTAEEIWTDTEGLIHAFVAGVGTGGTLTGVARVLKAKKPGLKVIAVEPRASAVLSGGEPGLHGIQGLGAGFIPKVLDRTLIDHVYAVTDVAADRTARRLAQEEGLLVGTSAGANVYAAVELAKTLPPGQRVVTILCDSGERYLC